MEVLSQQNLGNAATTKIVTQDLRAWKKEELLKQPDHWKMEQYQLRVTKVTGGATSKLSEIVVTCKSIASVLTVLTRLKKASGNTTRASSRIALRTCDPRRREPYTTGQAWRETEDQGASLEGETVAAVQVCTQGLRWKDNEVQNWL